MEYTSIMGVIQNVTDRANELARDGWIVQQIMAAGVFVKLNEDDGDMPVFVCLLCRQKQGNAQAPEQAAPTRRVIGRVPV